MPPPPRQTLSYLRNLFARRGLAPQHRHGQNFLIDLNIHDLIARAAELGPDDVVLEVGPGAGALTARLAEHAAAVVAVEIDPGMARLTAEAVADRPNARILNIDALAGKHRLAPELIDAVRAGLADAPGRRLKLVANLPFNVATPLIANLLVHPELRPARLVVTIQRELAERMTAPPGTEHYSALSVLVQALADVEVVRILPPSVFWPRPKVESAVIQIVPDPARRAAIPDLVWFHAIVRRVFLHRRKNLRRVLYSAWRARWTKAEVDAMLEQLGLTGEIRAEALNVEEWIALAEAVKARLGPEAVREIGGALEVDDEAGAVDKEDGAGAGED
jgi:16S rRNA (adenine1518-N6/adenine1519-N6)-dimethyltransferase